MRTIAGWLRGLAGLLLRLADSCDPPAPVVADPVVTRARVLCLAQEGIKGRSGEAKRHQVLARLMKDFPTVSMRQLARAIETAVEDL